MQEPIDRMSQWENLHWHGCLTGDCPHDRSSECLTYLEEYIGEACIEIAVLASIVRSIIDTKDTEVLLRSNVERLEHWLKQEPNPFNRGEGTVQKEVI